LILSGLFLILLKLPGFICATASLEESLDRYAKVILQKHLPSFGKSENTKAKNNYNAGFEYDADSEISA
jgi:hypothetical protein